MLSKLPTEITIQILEYADFQSIVACGATCRALRDTTTLSESLLYITLLGATGLAEQEGKKTQTLSVSNKLAQVREYDRVGSRGGSLAIYSRGMPPVSALFKGSAWIIQRVDGEGGLVIRKRDLGGPRCTTAEPQENALISIFGFQACKVLNYDHTRDLLVVVYRIPENARECRYQIWGKLGSESDAQLVADLPGGLPGSRYWSTYGSTLSYQSRDGEVMRRTLVDLRSKETLLTYEVPERVSFETYCHDVVAEDMFVNTSFMTEAAYHELYPDSAGSPTPQFDVYLLNGRSPPSMFTLLLPEFNAEGPPATLDDEWRSTVVTMDMPSAPMNNLTANIEEGRLFHAHWLLTRPDSATVHFLVFIHIPRLRAFLRSRTASTMQPQTLKWDEWAAHARIILLHPPPEAMVWQSTESSCGMRIACWTAYTGTTPLLEQSVTSAMARRITILDFHPRRAARASTPPRMDSSLVISDGLRGSGPVKPFVDENVYAGGLVCAEYTYSLPPEVAQSNTAAFEVHAMTMDGVILLYRDGMAGTTEYIHCAMQMEENA